MPSNHVIHRIEVIQNFWLWQVYQIERKRLVDKLKNEPETVNLWHGTRTNKPSMIYESQEGFDKRYANENGMWGPAIYFAQNASYSHAYAYVESN
jgi:hypothetical protein